MCEWNMVAVSEPRVFCSATVGRVSHRAWSEVLLEPWIWQTQSSPVVDLVEGRIQAVHRPDQAGGWQHQESKTIIWPYWGTRWTDLHHSEAQHCLKLHNSPKSCGKLLLPKAEQKLEQRTRDQSEGKSKDPLCYSHTCCYVQFWELDQTPWFGTG